MTSTAQNDGTSQIHRPKRPTPFDESQAHSTKKSSSRFSRHSQIRRMRKTPKPSEDMTSLSTDFVNQAAFLPDDYTEMALASFQDETDKKILAGTEPPASFERIMSPSDKARYPRIDESPLLPSSGENSKRNVFAGQTPSEPQEYACTDRLNSRCNSYGSMSTAGPTASLQDSNDLNLPGSGYSRSRSPLSHSRSVQAGKLLHPSVPMNVEFARSPLPASFFYAAKAENDTEPESDDDSKNEVEDDTVYTAESDSFVSSRNQLSFLDIHSLLLRDAKIDEDGKLYFEDVSGWTLSGFLRHFVYNPINPEFNVQQLNVWAAIIGIAMGMYTAAWKCVVERAVDHVWMTIPRALLDLGVFTDTSGTFPLYHYMWICPAVFGSFLSYIFAAMRHKIPDQNEWIENIHIRGVQSHQTFVILVVLCTLAMCSGLSLGPELPLILTGGMFGSWIALSCNQSILHARVLNLLAASAAVGGFFGFPLAGALFVLEIPHRTGLEYYEALIPAISSSVYAVLTNRLLTDRYVTGYFSYPSPSLPLPSIILPATIIFSLYGVAVGYGYSRLVKILKTVGHDLFHKSHGDDKANTSTCILDGSGERLPLVQEGIGFGRGRFAQSQGLRIFDLLKSHFRCIIPCENKRAAVVGLIAGAVCGAIGIFVPHTMFWGEAQLQTMIDQGKTPLPKFGQVESPMAAMGFCMIDSSDPAAVKAGFSIGCSVLITVAKTFHVGLSLGTGIIGGHFWGPLFVGCAASHAVTDIITLFAEFAGLGKAFAASYRCIIILCTMSSAHVVTFRTSLAIAIILTLTITAFDDEDNSGSLAAFSGVLSLLVISANIAFMVSVQTVFYKTQDSRRDVVAVPQVLCQPGMEGRPLIYDFDMSDEDLVNLNERDLNQSICETVQTNMNSALAHVDANAEEGKSRGDPGFIFSEKHEQTLSQLSGETCIRSARSLSSNGNGHSGLFMDKPVKSHRQGQPSAHRAYRCAQSASLIHDPHSSRASAASKPLVGNDMNGQSLPCKLRRSGGISGEYIGSRIRIHSFGELNPHQPSLMDQARTRAASSGDVSHHRRFSSRASTQHSQGDSESISSDRPPSPTTSSVDCGSRSPEEIGIEESLKCLDELSFSVVSRQRASP